MYSDVATSQCKKYSRLIFIDEPTFVSLQSKAKDIHAIADEVSLGKGNSMSMLTAASIREINERVHSALFDQGPLSPLGDSVSKVDETYVKSSVKSFLSHQDGSDYVVCSVGDEMDEVKYCDLIAAPSPDEFRLMVVVKLGFFDLVTENKEKLMGFILNCLSFFYKYDSDMESLLKLYTKLKFNEGYFDLVKLRFSR